MNKFKYVFFLLVLSIFTACSTQAQPTPTNVPPPPNVTLFGWTAPTSASNYAVVTYQLWIGTNSQQYYTNVSTTNTTTQFSNWNWGNNYVAVTASASNMTSPYSTELIKNVPFPIGAPTSLASP